MPSRTMHMSCNRDFACAIDLSPRVYRSRPTALMLAAADADAAVGTGAAAAVLRDSNPGMPGSKSRASVFETSSTAVTIVVMLSPQRSYNTTTTNTGISQHPTTLSSQHHATVLLPPQPIMP